jgi:hypothetical protein
MFMKTFALAAAAAGALTIGAAVATPASAKVKTVAFTACAATDISPNASDCVGWLNGNLDAGSPAAQDASAAALNDLLNVTTFDGDTLTWLQNIDSLSGPTVNFTPLLYGTTVVAFHVGGANGQSDGVGYQSTAFYVFDAGTTGLDTFTFNLAGLSNARLYSTGSAPCTSNCGPGPGVPEPSAWALMIVGFGGAGGMLRRRRPAVA